VAGDDVKAVYALLLALALFATLGGVAQTDGGWTPAQVETIRLWYVYAEYYGLRDVDTELGLRILYRESGFQPNAAGDCFYGYCLSIGPAQLHEFGVYRSTPYFREYGLAGRWITEVNIASMAWAFNRGMQSHWRPWEQVRWLAVVPSDPRKVTP
jgi:hypothetical protein